MFSENVVDETIIISPNEAETAETTESMRTMTVPVSKIKLRISDEWGRRINSIESPGSDLFDERDVAVASDVMDDAFGISGDVTKTAAGERQMCCAKCSQSCGDSAAAAGVNMLMLQFSSSFD